MTRATFGRFGVLLLCSLAPLLCVSGAAFAHVTVHPGTATAGSEAVLTFRVPTEKEHASTVKLVIAFPTEPPIPVVSVEPVPGWSARVQSRKLAEPLQSDDGPVSRAVSRVTWTAKGKGDATAPGQFRRYTIEAGPLPHTKRLVFKVLQYYSDGSVVRWIDPPTEGGGEPAHPAPTVALVTGASAANTDHPAAANSAAAVTGDGWIAVAAFVAGLLGLGAGTSALVVARHSGGDSSVRNGRK